MVQELTLPSGGSKAEKYKALLPQIEALVKGEPDLTANMANISAALKYGMEFFWVGFYRVVANELVLGPFQGPVACTRIEKGKGVCGTAWEKEKTIIVPNVEDFPGHIACSAESKSEIVLPIFKYGKVALVLDVDSEKLNDFNETDQKGLEDLIKIIEKRI